MSKDEKMTSRIKKGLLKAGKLTAQNLWTVILDIVAVNLAYFMALIIRFYVQNQMTDEALLYFLPAYANFAPFYTVACIIVFILCRLYGGMWQYAGLNDMNRILGANAITVVIQVVGTWAIMPPKGGPARMPVSYYVIGAILQFAMIAMIRFGYRILLVEKRKVAGRKVSTVPAMIIGGGETARKAIVHMEETPYRAMMAVDAKDAGRSMNGIPVIADYEKALANVKAVFIADRKLTPEKRKEIRKRCEEENIEVQDYTGVLSNLGGRVPVASLLWLTRGPVTLVNEWGERTFPDGEVALKELQDRYEVDSIEGAKIFLRKSTSGAYVGYDAWAEQHKEDTGEDVSFF